jgi:predicted nucleic acid-binding protein
VISYLDTSFLFKLYIFESESDQADDLLQPRNQQPLISWLPEVEMASALTARSADAAGEPERLISQAALLQFRLDSQEGLYRIVATNQAVFERAKALALQYGPKYRVRALDILHVAAALHHGATAFGTFDRRQASMAQDEGLNLLE